MGRCSNAIGLRLGKRVKWNNTTVKFQGEQTYSEIFFYRQLLSYFRRRSVISSNFIFCGLSLTWDKGFIIADVQLYDSKDIMGVKIAHGRVESFKDIGENKYIENFAKNINFYGKRFEDVLFKIQRHNFIRLALLEKGILFLAKQCFSERVYVRFKILKNENVTSLLISTYLCVKLKQQYFLFGLTKPVVKLLNTIPGLVGYKIRYAGRFNRNPRGRKQVFRGGSLSLSKVDTKVDYNENHVILKFGKCGLKVWLNTNEKFKKYKVAVKLCMQNGKSAFKKRA